MKIAGPLHPPFSLFGRAKKRKRAVHGPKEKKRFYWGRRARLGAGFQVRMSLPAARCGRGFWRASNRRAPLSAAAALAVFGGWDAGWFLPWQTDGSLPPVPRGRLSIGRSPCRGGNLLPGLRVLLSAIQRKKRAGSWPNEPQEPAKHTRGAVCRNLPSDCLQYSRP